MVLGFLRSMLVMATLGGSLGARAAELQFGGSVEAGVGGKPEFVEADGAGRYALLRVVGKVAVDETYSLSLMETVTAVEEPQEEAVAADPRLTLSYLPNLLESAGLKLSPSLTLIPGLSIASRDGDYYGGLRAAASVSKQLGDATLGLGVGFTRHFRRYTFTTEATDTVPVGTPTAKYTASGSIFGAYDVGAGFSLSANVTYIESIRHEGSNRYIYESTFGVGYAATQSLSFEVSLFDSDAQRMPDGTENNEFAVYRQNETEVYVGATYAL